MTVPYFSWRYVMTQTMLATAGGQGAATLFLWGVVAGAVQLVAVVRVLRLPARWWPHGRWSKTAAVVIALWLSVKLGSLALPVGAAGVIWHTRAVARRVPRQDVVPDLPMAEGMAEDEGTV